MSTSTSTSRSSLATPGQPSGLAYGTVLAAGIVMLIGGILEFFRGLTALFTNTLYVSTPKYILEFNVTSWGWVHLIWGLVLVAAGGLIVAGRRLGRILALVPASIAVILNFVSMPWYPLWSMVLLAINVFVIWALCTAEFPSDR
jgi:hypothetical protein